MWRYHFGEANNCFVNSNFNKTGDKESCIISWDANSLYSTAMGYKLPQGEPKFDNNLLKCTPEYIQSMKNTVKWNEKYFYIFVADIHYPKKIHDRDFECPLLCDHEIPQGDNVKKLMPTFYCKKNYPISLYMWKYILKKD